MQTELLRLIAAVITATALVAAPAANAGKDRKTSADTMVTVYVSGHGGASIAKKINEMHLEMEARGWRFADMEVHTENADTEGAWVTYVK